MWLWTYFPVVLIPKLQFKQMKNGWTDIIISISEWAWIEAKGFHKWRMSHKPQDCNVRTQKSATECARTDKIFTSPSLPAHFLRNILTHAHSIISSIAFVSWVFIYVVISLKQRGHGAPWMTMLGHGSAQRLLICWHLFIFIDKKIES